MPRALRRLLVLAVLVASVAALRSYLFAVNERRYRDAFTPPAGTLPNPSDNGGQGTAATGDGPSST